VIHRNIDFHRKSEWVAGNYYSQIKHSLKQVLESKLGKSFRGAGGGLVAIVVTAEMLTKCK
jgi:hypothetical protein